jgi:hypothetical protein
VGNAFVGALASERTRVARIDVDTDGGDRAQGRLSPGLWAEDEALRGFGHRYYTMFAPGHKPNAARTASIIASRAPRAARAPRITTRGSRRLDSHAAKPLVFHRRNDAGSIFWRLRGAVQGDVLTDPASRGRYATDASIYQVMPIGVLVPRSDDDVRIAMSICAELSLPMLPRGAGSSQCGQTVGAALVIDHSKHLNRVVDFDPVAQTVTVEPGMVLDALNAWLRPHGLWFPVDVSTSAQATLCGMAGNNSCGSRSLAYGNMVHNVVAIDARLADGTEARFAPERAMDEATPRMRALLGRRPQGAAARRRLQRRRVQPAERASLHTRG